MTSAPPRPCAGCSRDLGYVVQTLSITYDGWRYGVCGRGCLDRLMQRLSSWSSTTTSATGETVRVFGVAHYRKLP